MLPITWKCVSIENATETFFISAQLTTWLKWLPQQLKLYFNWSICYLSSTKAKSKNCRTKRLPLPNSVASNPVNCHEVIPFYQYNANLETKMCGAKMNSKCLPECPISLFPFTCWHTLDDWNRTLCCCTENKISCVRWSPGQLLVTNLNWCYGWAQLTKPTAATLIEIKRFSDICLV